MRHPEVSMDVLLGVAPLLVPDQDDRDLLDLRQPRDDGGVVSEPAIAVELEETGRNDAQIVEGVGSPRMARELHALPAGQLGIDVAAEPLRLSLETLQLLHDLRPFRRGHAAEVLDATLQIHDRFFEIEPGPVHAFTPESRKEPLLSPRARAKRRARRGAP